MKTYKSILEDTSSDDKFNILDNEKNYAFLIDLAAVLDAYKCELYLESNKWYVGDGTKNRFELPDNMYNAEKLKKFAQKFKDAVRIH